MSADFQQPQSTRRLRVLVLDDEPLISTLLADWLEELDCEPIGPANSVKEAMSFIEAHTLDGAILDVSLKNEDSFPAADALLGRSVPFAFATGRQPDSLDKRFANAEFLLKPFNFDAVKALVESWSKTTS